MDLDRRKKIIIGVAIAILVLLIALVAWWFSHPSAPINSSPSRSTGPTSALPSAPPTTTSAPPVSAEQSTATRLARLFTERFGTFTSQGDFSGIRDLDAVVTNSMQAWMDGTYIAGLRAKYPATSYVAQTTEVLGLTTSQISDTAAVIMVRTQQAFTNGDKPAVITNPTLKVTLVKTAGVWQVDSATWAK